ncbi:restriction endonuclease subunit S [Thiothrix winogradskyi]|uniref:Restriction endonuclease subunit S n=1 Tax=Thiothrix winogradskyi TaxID=96472 RepID=A0ABY3STN2_9GAMM|nr:restriction endonuclease subunit S [Thiothrix winogradskyi]UJS22795.1 restriction endonuclease subunit S [Thiothrix winogradskyi]
MLKAGWQTKKFSDVLDIRNGRNQKAVESESGTYPVLGSAGNVMGYATDYICEAGTTIIGRKGNISTPIYVETKFWNVDTAFGLSPKAGLNNKFLYYYCLSYDFAALNRGTTIPSLVKSELLEISIPLPPLPEQTRIVAILDEAFANISQAVANAEKNLANTRELFDSYLNKVFASSDERVKLSEITTVISDGDHSPPPKAQEGIPFITISNVNKNTRLIDFSDTFKVPQSYFDALKDTRKPFFGDVLYTVTGSYGIPIKVPHGVEFCFQRHIGLLRPKKNINSSWLYYALLSPSVYEQASSGATGTAQKTVSLNVLRNIEVPMMSESEQVSAVEKLDLFWAQKEELEDIYRRKLAALAELKQALLQKAFTGELTAN